MSVPELAAGDCLPSDSASEEEELGGGVRGFESELLALGKREGQRRASGEFEKKRRGAPGAGCNDRGEGLHAIVDVVMKLITLESGEKMHAEMDLICKGRLTFK